MSLLDALCTFDWISPAVQLGSELFGYAPLAITAGPDGEPVKAVLDVLTKGGVQVGMAPYWQPGAGLMLTVSDANLARRILARCGYEVE